MSELRVYNGGDMVSRRIDLDLLSREGAQAELVEQIAEACTDLTEVRFESEEEVYNYGDSVAHYLVVYGIPQGELAEVAKKQWADNHAQWKSGVKRWAAGL